MLQKSRKQLLFIAVFLSFIPLLRAQQGPEFLLDRKEASIGDTVSICLKANDFNNVISFQFTISWDSTRLRYMDYQAANLPNIQEENLAGQLASGGILPVTWNDNSGAGLSLPDSSDLLCFDFLVTGTIGDSIPLFITDQPTFIEVGQLVDGEIVTAEITTTEGYVIIVADVLTARTESQPNICFETPAGTLSATAFGGVPPYTFSWSGPNAYSASGAALENLAAGQYVLVLADSNGGLYSDTIEVAGPLTPLSFNTIEIQQADCGVDNGQIHLSAEGGTPPYRYDFGSGLFTANTIENLAPGPYVLLIEDNNGCMLDTMITLEATGGDGMIQLPEEQILCAGDSVQIEAPSGFQEYRWFLDGQELAAATSTITALSAGTYRLEAIDTDGCFSQGTASVRAAQQSGRISGNTSINFRDSTQLQAGPGTNYRWTPAVGLSCTDCATPLAYPTQTTDYILDYLSTEGCPVSDSVTVTVNYIPGELRVTPVTFFSPNGDGQNDELIFPGLETYQANELKVYSRWGQILYSKVNYQLDAERWDGTLRGEDLPAGVYYYILRVDDDEISIKQTLTLSR